VEAASERDIEGGEDCVSGLRRVSVNVYSGVTVEVILICLAKGSNR